jgi:hypothetical protein
MHRHENRTERRGYLTDGQRVIRLEEDLDHNDVVIADIRGELKSQTRLLTSILLTLLGSTIAVIGTVVVTGP